MATIAELKHLKSLADELDSRAKGSGAIEGAIYSQNGLIDFLRGAELVDLQEGLDLLKRYIDQLNEVDSPAERSGSQNDELQKAIETVWSWAVTEQGWDSEAFDLVLSAARRSLRKHPVEIPDGATVTEQTREVDGVFQQRVVIQGAWAPAERPSGLL